jgi:hypothetical protein
VDNIPTANIRTGFRAALFYLFICLYAALQQDLKNVQFGDMILRHLYSELK